MDVWGILDVHFWYPGGSSTTVKVCKFFQKECLPIISFVCAMLKAFEVKWNLAIHSGGFKTTVEKFTASQFVTRMKLFMGEKEHFWMKNIFIDSNAA